MSQRPFKRIWGVAYKNVLKGDNPTQQVTASQHDRDELYNDPAIRLSEQDLKRFKSLRGKPICREHDPDVVLGHIHIEDLDESGDLRVAARIYTDTDEGREALAQLERGELNGLSVGYTTNMIQGTRNVASKSFNELTLTREPFFEGCRVTVQASKSVQEKKNLASKESTYNTEVLWINLSKQNMSDQANATNQPNTTPTPPGSNDTTNTTTAQPAAGSQSQAPVEQKEASSLLKVADGLQSQVDEAKANANKERMSAEELRRQNEKQAQELAELRAFKQRELEEYAKAKEAEAKETLAIHEEMRGQAFSPDVKQAMIQTMCSKNPVDLQKTEILCSQASAYKAQKEANLKKDEEIKALQAKLAKKEEDDQILQQRITASRQGVRDLYGARSSEIHSSSKGKEEEDSDITFDVNASRGNSSSMAPDNYFPNRGRDTIVIPQASPFELDLPYFKQTPAATVQVTASKDRHGAPVMTMKAAPTHNLVDKLPYSMRNARNAHWFSLMVSQADTMMEAPDAVFRSNVPGDGERKFPDFSKDELE